MKSQPPNLKNVPTFNTISKNKKPHESDLRVHFTLMNIKWKCKQQKRQQKLIQSAFNSLNNLFRVQFAQISSIVTDELYDISVGLFSDEEAYHFLLSKKPIHISDGSKEHEYQPVVSRAFQSFMNWSQKANENAQLEKKYSSHDVYPNSNQIQRQKSEENPEIILPMNQQEAQRRKKQTIWNSKFQGKQLTKIWAFGIPKEFQIPEIVENLKSYGFVVSHSRWKMKQHMEFLEIDLSKSISRSSIYYLGPQISNFPYILIPPSEDGELYKELSRYTVQIITAPSPDDQQKFIKCMGNIGGVNIMLRTPLKQKQEYRYLVAFNSVGKAEKACQVAKNLKECTAHVKQFQLKIGRVNKYFSFAALFNELNFQKL